MTLICGAKDKNIKEAAVFREFLIPDLRTLNQRGSSVYSG
jgi:hypothetical protein